jgi:hypothetical protein
VHVAFILNDVCSNTNVCYSLTTIRSTISSRLFLLLFAPIFLRKALQNKNAQTQRCALATSLKIKGFFAVPPSQIEHRLVVAPGIVLVM